MKVFLIGMPGSGKSTLGKQLSGALHLPFIDLDDEIVIAEKKSIADIFKKRGEPYFRELERELLVETMALHEQFILATGGGTPCFFDNLEIMKKKGKVVFLNTSLPIIKKRLIDNEIAKRPLLKGLNISNFEKEFNTKFQKRDQIYKQAHLVIDETTSVDNLLKMLDS